MDEREERINKYKKDMDKKQKKSKPFKIIIIILLFIIIGLISWKVIDKYIPNFKQISLRTAFPEWSEDGLAIILSDVPIRMEKPAIEQDGEIYLPVEFIKQYIDEYIFWEEPSQNLTITTEKKVIRMKTDDLTAYVNDEVLKLNIPIEMINDTAYMPKVLLESLYDISIIYSPDTDIVMVDYTDKVKSTGTIIDDKVSVRDKPNIKNGIITKLNSNDEVIVYSEEQIDNWTKIRTNTGIVGYISSKKIGNIVEIQPEPKEIEPPSETWQPTNGKINMAWDQVFNVEASVNDNRIKAQKGLDVLSPTWFSIADEKGTIKNIANKKYVDWAHKEGYKVWPLIDNQFSGKLTHKVLSDPDARKNIIKQLLALIATYDLDGINVDFENVNKEDGDYYLQFIRELTPFLKAQGAVVSVDVYVPAPWTQHYQRDELAKIVDYVVIMAYDEHWSTSENSGSVASIGWVEKSVKESLEQIPKEKLIMGIPYFTRLWIETPTDGKVTVKSEAYGMNGGKKVLEDNKVEPVWDGETGQYYGEYQKDNITYKIWLEDERSIEEKLKLVEKYDLAGISGWKRGLEKDSIWDVLYENLKK